MKKQQVLAVLLSAAMMLGAAPVYAADGMTENLTRPAAVEETGETGSTAVEAGEETSEKTAADQTANQGAENVTENATDKTAAKAADQTVEIGRAHV